MKTNENSTAKVRKTYGLGTVMAAGAIGFLNGAVVTAFGPTIKSKVTGFFKKEEEAGKEEACDKDDDFVMDFCECEAEADEDAGKGEEE